jgi:hypothetical protein
VFMAGWRGSQQLTLFVSKMEIQVFFFSHLQPFRK